MSEFFEMAPFGDLFTELDQPINLGQDLEPKRPEKMSLECDNKKRGRKPNQKNEILPIPVAKGFEVPVLLESGAFSKQSMLVSNSNSANSYETNLL